MNTERPPDTDAAWRLFWAKTDREGERGPEWTRPLWAHLIDVANTAELTWERVLPPGTRTRLAAAVGLSEEDAGRWFSLMIGMHDIGKAIPSFQAMHAPSRARLAAAGITFRSGEYAVEERLHHGHASIPVMIDWLRRHAPERAWQDDTIEGIAATVGFHHGKLATRDCWLPDGRFRINAGTKDWEAPRFALLDAVVEAWGAPMPAAIAGRRMQWPSWLMELAGWCTMADWLGSMAREYPDVAHADDMRAYVAASRAGAKSALIAAGFGARAALRPRSFGELFADNKGNPRTPRELQSVMIEAIPSGAGHAPTLTIAEASTGEGKTEAALVLTLRQQADGGPGFYTGMPSQATSNGLFGRVERFLERAHDPTAGGANLLLVHGSSTLDPAQERLRLRFLDPRHAMEQLFDGEGLTASDRARVETAGWFMPKKRSLLAPYGVGTVDQALLGVLYAKHFFLRHIGLAGKTVIFDEVHAYDTYMNALFRRLLCWLRSNGAHVIVLSATLPGATRRGMIEAWTGRPCIDTDIPVTPEPDAAASPSPHPPYPIVWHVHSGADGVDIVHGHRFAATLHQRATLCETSAAPDDVVQSVIGALRAGAAVAVIVNTVARAQELFRAVSMALETETARPEAYLFHARFPYELRRNVEAAVMERFGERRQPGVPALLVATQVAEQSLDIDVDVMFSDLAPIDLLLQRAGRLHRHRDHHAGQRPAGFADPILHVMVPGTTVDTPARADALPNFDAISGGGKVYDTARMMRTWWALRGRTGWNLPDDYRGLIESVYADGIMPAPEALPATARARWPAAEPEMSKRYALEEDEAKRRAIPAPQKLRDMVLAEKRALNEQDDAPIETHPAYLALTRLGGPSFDVVCLHIDTAGRLWLDPGHREPLPSRAPLSDAATRRLMECTVKLSGEHLIPAVKAARTQAEADGRWHALVADNAALARHDVMMFRDRHWHSNDGSHHFLYDTIYGIIRPTRKDREVV